MEKAQGKEKRGREARRAHNAMSPERAEGPELPGPPRASAFRHPSEGTIPRGTPGACGGAQHRLPSRSIVSCSSREDRLDGPPSHWCSIAARRLVQRSLEEKAEGVGKYQKALFAIQFNASTHRCCKQQRTVVAFRRRARRTHNTEPSRAIARLVGDKNNCAYHVVFSVSVFLGLKNLFVCACLNGRFFSCRKTDVCGHFGLSFVGIEACPT